MNIQTLIDQLNALKEKHGNLSVLVKALSTGQFVDLRHVYVSDITFVPVGPKGHPEMYKSDGQGDFVAILLD